MSATTSIEWTHVPGYRGASWNPVVGCSRKSSGCEHCYAEVMASRIANSALAKLRKQVPQDAQQAILHQRPSDALGVLRSYMQDLTPTEQAYLDAVPWEHGGYNGPLHLNDKALPQWSRKLITLQHALEIPLKTKAPTAWFVNSMSDLFHESVPFEFIDQVFAVMALCPQHLFLILTKRPDRMAEFFSTRDRFAVVPPSKVKPFADQWAETGVHNITQHQHPLPNVWLGTSVEDQKTVDERIPQLLRVPAAVRFLSCEPLLGATSIRAYLPHHYEGINGEPYQGQDDDCTVCGTKTNSLHWVSQARSIDWVIAGGESGPKARPMHPDWARGLRDQCDAAGVPFFFKQWGAWYPERFTMQATQEFRESKAGRRLHVDGEAYWNVGKHNAGRLLDGVEHNGWPEVITKMISETPDGAVPAASRPRSSGVTARKGRAVKSEQP